MELTKQEAMNLITRVGPSLGCGDFTYSPSYPDGRNDVAAVQRMAEDGHSYGFDVIYLVWKDQDGKIHYKELVNSRSTKDYLNVTKITCEGDNVTVELGTAGTYSGNPWKGELSLRI